MSMPMDQVVRVTPSRWAWRARAVRIATKATQIPARVRWSLLLFIFTVPFESITLSQDFTITKAFGLVFFASLLTCPKIFSVRFSPAAWWFLGYLILVFASGVLLPREFLRSFGSGFLTMAQLFFLFIILSNLLRDGKLARNVLLAFAIGACILGAGSLLGLPGFSPETRTVTQGRGTALEFNPNYLAAMMALAAVILIGLRLDRNAQPLWQKILLPMLTLIPLSLIVHTGSRTGAAAFIIGVALYLLPYRASRHKMLAICLGIAAVMGMVYLVASRPDFLARWEKTYYEGNLTKRDVIWSAAIEMISEKPYLGWQPVISEQELGWRLGSWGGGVSAHSLYFHLLAEVGVIGAIPFFIGLALCAWAAWKARAGSLGMLPIALMATLLAYNIAGTGIRQKLLWVLLAVIVAAASSTAQMEKTRPAMLSRRKSGKAKNIMPPALHQA